MTATRNTVKVQSVVNDATDILVAAARRYGVAQAAHAQAEHNLKSVEANAFMLAEAGIEAAGYPKGWGANDAQRKANIAHYTQAEREKVADAYEEKVIAESEYNAARMIKAQAIITASLHIAEMGQAETANALLQMVR